MKKCPKCKAEIQENARFCLYCMTSFEEKQIIKTPKERNKRWLFIIVAVLVFAIIVSSVFLFPPKASTSGKIDTTTKIDGTTSAEQQNEEPKDDKTSAYENSNQTQKSDEITDKSSDTTVTDTAPTRNKAQKNTTSKKSTNTTQKNKVESVPTNSSSNNNKTEKATTKNNSTVATTLPKSTTAKYSYRSAQYGDDYSVGANLDNAVVITGVKTPCANGRYEIPETLNGKRVIAIMPLAFSDSDISVTVKTVVVPSSVKTIWNNAFANCYNLTDIYFKGNSIYTESNAFAPSSKRNGTLTIHCSSNCSDRNYRYYRNSASDYGAKYKEWNG